MKNSKPSSRYVFAAVAVLLLASTACNRSHTIKQYQKDGVQFSYYSDWTIRQDAMLRGAANVRAINMEGPEHAVVSLIFLPPSNQQTLEDFASAVAKRRDAAIENKLSIGSFKTAEVNKGSSAAVTQDVAGEQQQGIMQHFTIDLLGTQVPHEARFFMVQSPNHHIMVMSQFADQYAATGRPSTELIMRTLSVD
jgi:hypothetical protein